MVRKSNYDTSAPDRPKPALWKVIKIFLRLKFDEIVQGAWMFVKGAGIFIGMLTAMILGLIAAGFCFYYSLILVGITSRHLLNLIGHVTTRPSLDLGVMTLSALAGYALVLMMLFFFVAWIRNNWIKAKRLAVDEQQ